MKRLLASLVLVSVAVVGVSAALAAGKPSPQLTDPAEGVSPDLTRAAARQEGTYLKLEAGGADSLQQALTRDASYVCFRFASKGGSAVGQLCVRGPKAGAVAYTFDAGGKVVSRKRLAQGGRFDRDGALTLTVPVSASGLKPGAYAWRALAAADANACPPVPAAELPCADNLPDRGTGTLSLTAPKLVGCKARPRDTWSRAGGSGKEVALTFDDGPSQYTSTAISVLQRMHATGTFFVLGNQIPGQEDLLRREMSLGFEVANHSFNHANLGGGGAGARQQMSSTNARIKAATGFTPCVFRPPYGATSGALANDAKSFGMNNILWDVDPRDWSTPGAGAIYSRITGSARAGSIILMHDGGGPRGQTLAALPRVIGTLRARGYKFRTVSELIGNKPVYR